MPQIDAPGGGDTDLSGMVALIFRAALLGGTEADLGRTCLDAAEALTQSRFGVIGRIDRRTGVLDRIAVSDAGRAAGQMPDQTAQGPEPSPDFALTGVYGRVLRGGAGLIANDLREQLGDIDLPPRHPPLHAFLGMPLVHKGDTIGLIGLGNRDNGYGREQLAAVEALAPAIAQALVSKRAEMALRARERRLDAIVASEAFLGKVLDASLNGLYVYDLEHKTNVFINRQYTVLTGYSLDTLKGMSESEFAELFHPEDRAAVLEHMSEVGQVADGEVLEIEYRFRTAGGDWIWCLSRDTVFTRDRSGRIVQFIGAFLDVTERRRTEAALRESEERLRLFIEHAPVALAMFDRQMRYLAVSDRWLTDYGLSDRSILGRSHYAIFPEIPARWKEAHRRGMAGQVLRSDEDRFERLDGRVQWLRWEVRAWQQAEDGGVGGIVIFTEDVTVRKQAEEALRESDRRKDEFLATLAHELRNPLAPLRNAAAILKLTGTSDPTINTARDVIDRQVSHMVRLIDDLLDVSRIARGKLQVRKERVELAAILERAVEAVQPVVERCGQELTVSLPAAPIHLQGDAVRLTQVFSNLLGNASSYTPSGGRIHLSVETDRGEARVQVADSGVGIPVEQLERIFEMFYQVPTGSERVQSGLGIGLSLVRGLVTMHGGRVEARSAGPGQGSTFVVWLPAEARHSIPQATQRELPNRSTTTAARILVVDDKEDVAESLALALRLQGEEVETARDGLEAVAAAERFRPDLVLLDLGMPRLDGFGACRRMRKTPWGRDLTIIAMTGWGQESDRRKTEESGFDAHWVKPVSPSEVSDFLASTRGGEG